MRIHPRTCCALTVLCLLLASPWKMMAQAQTGDDAPLKIGNVVFFGSVRTRVEGWDWFNAPGESTYGFSETLFRFGASESGDHVDWKLEFAAPVLLALPGHSVDAAPQGQLGFGGSYFASNSNSTNAAFVFPKQGFLRWHGGDAVKQALRLGRIEFTEGLELLPANKTIAALDRDRISNRLIGTFAFSVTGRSFDGGDYSVGTNATNFTVMAARPTRGVFQVDGWGEVDADVAYAAFTHNTETKSSGAQLRLFAIEYNDFRENVLKTDNRPAATRALDHGDIDILTFGGNYVGTVDTGAGTFDALGWGLGQTGTWGTQKQRAYAYAAEAGWQPKVSKIKPWLRGGYNYGSGDGNPKDNVHGTFFQILPTARAYARFPFFNMMNNRDLFGELVMRPSKRWTLRSDAHALALANKNDLWYSGGGAYNPWTFGYTGRTSNGSSSLANLYDISSDYTMTPHSTFGLYYGYAQAKSVIKAIYPKGADGNLGFVELTYRF